MTERSLWFRLRRTLAPYGALVRVENATGAGTPDVCYCLLGVTGWLELKSLPKWPARGTTVIRVPSLTVAQIHWLDAWSRAGGNAWLLLGISDDYFLFTSGQAADLFACNVNAVNLSSINRDTVGAAARRAVTTAALVKWLTKTDVLTLAKVDKPE